MSDPIITAIDLVKRYGKVRALDGLSLSIERGGIYGLLGPNGAGKTTLIRVLSTLTRADHGTVRVGGIDVHRNPAQVRGRIGLAGQFAAVDDYLTGRENVEMIGRLYGLSRREAKVRAADVLERINLLDAADRQVKTYSAGMRRRVDLAASLVGRPDILFLDEPTTGVDPASRRVLWDLIKDLVHGGTSVLLTTQYLEEADQLADRVAVIDHGRLISEGTTEQLKAQTGGSVLELSIHDSQREPAIAVLNGVNSGHATYDTHRAKIVVPASRGVDTLREALHRLDLAGIRPDDIGLHKPTLDDVFLHLTSRTPTTPAAEGKKS
ncbi:MAG TPA: daunorubicin/doxorubicin resistance ABC transporter ATP-binding protein DrrA [Micromonosporaceae bacterium]|nr:daunorubicin/doxorubicin resistance ABC transporter ATP-binding protein DrrA [Micromonosporaceae bacterium]HCU50501.1 daunorubicin/doxorubicin resistance ABC transporter ATP-binding protein DrrA [Micromonosporaceae bacterium]